MKKTFKILLLSFICFTIFSGCSKKAPIKDPIEDEPKCVAETITMVSDNEIVDLGVTSLMLTIQNDSAEVYKFDGVYTIEKFENDNWVAFGSDVKVTAVESPIEISAHSSGDIALDLTPYKELLSAGRYRIVSACMNAEFEIA